MGTDLKIIKKIKINTRGEKMNLVIVESPAKAKTIEKYLGKDFKVLASFGHVRDLPKKVLGVDIKNNYEPEYEIPPASKKTIAAIKKAGKDAKDIYLATDLDREGEAISWHVAQALSMGNDKSQIPNDKQISNSKFKRITFSEITKSALSKAVKNPREIDMNLVDAQQARRVLDRLVGYKLSPFLWKKVKSGLSAGRVQSVTVRLVVEREQEIKAFKPEEFWAISVILSKIGDDIKFEAKLIEEDGKPIKKMDIKNKKSAESFKKQLTGAKYKVIDVEVKDSKRYPSAPFTTSTLQMEASRKMGYGAKQTMIGAQKLYEAGHITYMRTDSINISSDAKAAAKKIIVSEYGKEYLPESDRVYATKTKRAQEAHEAIRPTHMDRKTVSDERNQKLYELIWKRTIASQMREAIFEVVKARVLADVKEKLVFLAQGETLKFDGFIKVYTEGRDEEEEKISTIPELEKDEKLDYHDLNTIQKFTEPPARYTEATLVKKLESLGIGRPSTYAPTMSTIQDRGYVRIEDKRFHPEEIGEIVTELLVKHFNQEVDYKFTAHIEDDFDDIADGKKEWQKVIDEFYVPFAKNLTEKNKEVDKDDYAKDEKTNEKCPDCKKPLVIRFGRFGKFKACSGYPDCKYSHPIEDKKADKDLEVVGNDGEMESIKEAEGEKCDKCGHKMLLKEGRFGKFMACENYPKCKNTQSIVNTTGMKCPDCGEGEVIERHSKKGKKFWGCSRYPGCKYASWENPEKKTDKLKN